MVMKTDGQIFVSDLFQNAKMETRSLVGDHQAVAHGPSQVQGQSIGHAVVFREYFIKLFWRILARFSPQDDDFDISNTL